MDGELPSPLAFACVVCGSAGFPLHVVWPGGPDWVICQDAEGCRKRAGDTAPI